MQMVKLKAEFAARCIFVFPSNLLQNELHANCVLKNGGEKVLGVIKRLFFGLTVAEFFKNTRRASFPVFTIQAIEKY